MRIYIDFINYRIAIIICSLMLLKKN